MFSCVDDPNFVPEVDSSANVVVSKDAISADDALANLLHFMRADGDATRSADHRIVSSIKPVKLRRVASRSISEALDCENLLYVANFENEEGYAIKSFFYD